MTEEEEIDVFKGGVSNWWGGVVIVERVCLFRQLQYFS